MLTGNRVRGGGGAADALGWLGGRGKPGSERFPCHWTIDVRQSPCQNSDMHPSRPPFCALFLDYEKRVVYGKAEE